MRFGQVAFWMALGASAGLGGCLEQPEEVTVHEPGLYKGAADPYIAVSGSAEQAEKLANRLRKIQTDR